MQHSGNHSSSRKSVEVTVHDLLASFGAGEDPRRTIKRLDASIVDCQRHGRDLPAAFLELSRTLAAECVAQGHARH